MVSLTARLMRVIQKNITCNLTWNPFQLRSMAMILVLPRCLAHIESNASASSRKPTPTAPEPSAAVGAGGLGHGPSVRASGTVTFAPVRAQRTGENRGNHALEPSGREARNSSQRPPDRALRSWLAAMVMDHPCVHQTRRGSPAFARPGTFCPTPPRGSFCPDWMVGFGSSDCLLS